MNDKTDLNPMDSNALTGALSRLAARNYGEVGIPMLLILENTAGETLPGSGRVQNASLQAELEVPTDPLTEAAGQTFRTAVASLASAGRNLAAGDLARIIEWVADERFGPEALATGQGDVQG